jgi:nicotinamide-nucleotide amidase
LTRPRAVILVTGSELVRGDRADANGPYLARELAARGIEPSRVIIVGDDARELEEAMREALAADLCVTSGGLGPTHDDRTVETLARVVGVDLAVDSELEAEIEAVSRRIAERLRRPYADFELGVRKQAMLPARAVSLGLAGTAPGFVLQSTDTTFVVLPGPPAELRRLWQLALEAEPVRTLLARASPPARRILRLFGASESEVASALADAGGEPAGVTATICAREFEIRVELFGPADELAASLRERLGSHLFAEDERGVEEIVLGLCRRQGLSLATAESCTGGLVAARLTSVAGSSDVFVGSVVSYADEVKLDALGVPQAVLAEHGAVSAEAAAAMAAGARERLGADVAVAVTGIAGPGGGTPEKPVGLVFLHAEAPQGALPYEALLPGDRAAVRGRAAAAALHLVRRLLTQNHDGSA